MFLRLIISTALLLMSSAGLASTQFDGAVFAMTNDFDANTVVAYGRGDDGRLTLIGEFATGGQGALFDEGEGLDPLISAFSLLLTEDRRFLLAVNAGSGSLSVFRVNDDFSLTLVDQADTFGVGPNSIAQSGRLVYVSVVDIDGDFNGPDDQSGGLTGFRLNPRGKLIPVPRSELELGARPSAIQFSPDGEFLVATAFNAGSASLASGSLDEVSVFRVRRNGRLQPEPVATAISTLPDNVQGRNLPSAIGVEVVADKYNQYVVVSEAREFRPDGSPPILPTLQTGSASTWRLADDGALTPVSQDVLAGSSFEDGGRTTCWIEFSADQRIFWLVNSVDATISAFNFEEGVASLLAAEAASGEPATDEDPFGTSDGFVDLWISDDGRFLYQLFGLDGSIGVYSTDGGLTLIQEVSGLPEINTQGIVAF